MKPTSDEDDPSMIPDNMTTAMVAASQIVRAAAPCDRVLILAWVQGEDAPRAFLRGTPEKMDLLLVQAAQAMRRAQ